MQRISAGILLALLFSLEVGVVEAAPPAITSLYPAGAQAGTSVTVTLTGSFDQWPVQTWTDHAEIEIKCLPKKGQLQIRVPVATSPGVAWLRLYDNSGTSELRPFLIGQLPDILEAEPNEQPGMCQHVLNPANIHGKLSRSGDVDVFAVTLVRGQTLVASLDAHQQLRSPIDAILQVVDSDQETILEQNHDHHGLDPQVAFQAQRDGVYYVRLFAFPSQPDSSIRHYGSDLSVYQLTLTTEGFLNSVFPFAAKNDEPAKILLHGWNLPSRTCTLSPTMNRVMLDRVANTMLIRRVDHDVHDLRAPRADAIPIPFTGSGLLNKNPATFQIKCPRKQTIALHLETVPLNSHLQPVVQILDKTDKAVAKFEPAKLHEDIEAIFVPPDDGNYRVLIRDLYGNYGPDCSYRITITEALPDFRPTLISDSLTVSTDKPLDVTVTTGIVHGFSEKIEWTIEGSPKSVSLTEKNNQDKPDGKSVTLQLTATKAGFAGPVKILGKSASGITRTVNCKLPNFDHSITTFWLTVVPKPKAGKKVDQ